MPEKLSAKFLDMKQYWNKPRPGEFLSNKQFFSYCMSGFFTELWERGPGLIGGFGLTWFCGQIMGIEMKDFVTVNLIGLIFGYLFFFLLPFGILIYENHGRLEPKQAKIMHIATISKILLGLSCYFLPSTFLQNIIRGFPYILGNMFFIGGILDYFNWFIRYRYSAKYGRVKPFIIISAIPSLIIGLIIPWINYPENYALRIAILHGVLWLATYFFGNLKNSGSMINFLTQNSQERQKLISYGPLIRGLGTSILGLVFSTIITATIFGITFQGYADINVYRYICPVFAILSFIGVLLLLPVKENLIEQKIDRPKVKFKKGALLVIKNKYFWISNLSTLAGSFQGILASLVTFWLIYNTRQLWMEGIVLNILYLGGTLGSMMAPSITKRFDKVRAYKILRIASYFMFFLQLMFFKIGLLWPYIIFCFITNPLNGISGSIGNGFNADILDYHQWKTGERADAMSGIFGWVFNPLISLVGYIGPYIYLRLGYTSDWNVFYDSVNFDRIFTYSFFLTIISAGLCIVPYLFYDLTTEKHKACIVKIRERERNFDIEKLEIRRNEGILTQEELVLLEKYLIERSESEIKKPTELLPEVQ